MRQAPPRLRLRGTDRALLSWMTRVWPGLLGAVQVVQPETVLRWHRAGFKMFWRWKSRRRAGRPRIDRGLRDLIQRMSSENPLWGASRIHGELLMLGFEVAQSTVSKYMVRRRSPPLQGWKAFLPDSRVVGLADHRGVSLGHGARLSGARQRQSLRICLHVSGEGDGYPRPTDFSWVAVAKWLCRTIDRHIAPRMPGSNTHLP